MFAVTGITGQVGGAVARTLLAKGCRVRAVVRDTNKPGSWANKDVKLQSFRAERVHQSR